MKTYTKYPLCERHNLLRTTYSGRVVVSSMALHKHLGEQRYQNFIATITDMKTQLGMGFWPHEVESFLRKARAA